MDESPAITFQQHRHHILFSQDLKIIIPCLISVISAAIVVILLIIGKFWTRHLSIMIFFINASDFFYGMLKVSVLYSTPSSSFSCTMMDAAICFGTFASSVWAVLFGHAFYKIIKSRNINIISSMLRYYIPISLIISLVAFLTTFLTDDILLIDDEVCVYRTDLNQIDFFELFHIQIPIAIMISLCIIYYILSFRELKKMEIEGNMGESLTLMIYPAILIADWGPFIIIQILGDFGVNTSESTEAAFQIVSYLTGFFDAIVYGEGVRGTWRGCCKKCIKKANHLNQTIVITTEVTTEKAGEYQPQIKVSQQLQDFQVTKAKVNFSYSSTSSILATP